MILFRRTKKRNVFVKWINLYSYLIHRRILRLTEKHLKHVNWLTFYASTLLTYSLPTFTWKMGVPGVQKYWTLQLRNFSASLTFIPKHIFHRYINKVLKECQNQTFINKSYSSNLREGSQKNYESGHMSKLGLPYLPRSLVWTKKMWTSTPIVYPTYLSKKFGHFWIEVCP